MFLEYQKTELKHTENFNTIYNGLKNGLLLLAYKTPIRTARDFAFAGIIECGDGLFRWRHYGSSAENATKKDLRFLFAEIFDDCDYFTLVDANTYSAQACAYYEAELKRKFEERSRK